jgi:hypothetical protein
MGLALLDDSRTAFCPFRHVNGRFPRLSNASMRLRKVRPMGRDPNPKLSTPFEDRHWASPSLVLSNAFGDASAA